MNLVQTDNHARRDFPLPWPNRITRNGRWTNTIEAHDATDAQAFARALRASRKRYVINAAAFKVSTRGTQVIINAGMGVKHYIVQAVVDYAVAHSEL